MFTGFYPTFKNKSLRKYYVDGIETVGAWGDEPFEIKFTNHTWQKVEVKLTVDGTDILTGELATSEPTAKMWVVNGYGTLSLKAWPETNNGGAQLVFTSGSNSVAVHTHGDMSNRGIIAAAVFTEGHVTPITYNPPIVINNHYPDRRSRLNDYYYGSTIGGSVLRGIGETYSSNSIPTAGSAKGSSSGTFSVQTRSLNAADSAGATMDSLYEGPAGEVKSLESLVAVGAGQHVDQKITTVAGLIKPTLSDTVRLKYMWWDELVAKLRENNVPMPHPSGFPADRNQTNIKLGGTPRIGSFTRAFPREKPAPEPFQSYLRV